MKFTSFHDKALAFAMVFLMFILFAGLGQTHNNRAGFSSYSEYSSDEDVQDSFVPVDWGTQVKVSGSINCYSSFDNQDPFSKGNSVVYMNSENPRILFESWDSCVYEEGKMYLKEFYCDKGSLKWVKGACTKGYVISPEEGCWCG